MKKNLHRKSNKSEYSEGYAAGFAESNQQQTESFAIGEEAGFKRAHEMLNEAWKEKTQSEVAMFEERFLRAQNVLAQKLSRHQATLIMVKQQLVAAIAAIDAALTAATAAKGESQ